MLDFFKKLVLVNKADTSVANTLNTTDVQKIVRDALLVGAAATITFCLNSLGAIDLGVYTPMIIPAISVIFNAALKYVKDSSTAK